MERICRGDYIALVRSLLGKGEAVVLTGHRRAGKSCILELLSAELSAAGHVIYIDMEDPANADITSFWELSEKIKAALEEGHHNFVLIDEVQEVSEFEKALRYWVKQDGVDVVVTGSNAAMLSSDIASSFAGRYHRVHVSSLDYREFLLFYELDDSDNAFSQYLRWGGLPFLYRIPLEDERTRTEYLGSIYDTIFVKDIVRRKNVRNVSLLDNLARFVADNCGKVFSANSIAKYLKGSSLSVSANTVGEYMDALCDTYMIDRVKRYDIKGKSIFEQQDKYYFEDLGLRNYLCRDKRSLDVEKVLEGAVYLKLKRSGYEVYVGQLNGKEIDFLARRGDEVIYVQVAVQVMGEDTYEREFGNLKLIKDNYPKYVVTMDPNVGLIHDSGIVACSARQFLLNFIS
ncbi:MAG: ATP-binding protein [Bacteroidaceae bacterium]|nr:ATP-binding protein [Bacteroidaceae bacterium]